MNCVDWVPLITAVTPCCNLCYSTLAVGVVRRPVLSTAAVYVPVNLLSMTLQVSHEAVRTYGAIWSARKESKIAILLN